MKEIYNDVIKESIYDEVLDNGLKVSMMVRKNFNRNYAVFATNYGSIDNHFIEPITGKEVKVTDGIAHFLEHKLFEGQKEDAFTKFAKLGAAANAYTSYTSTSYLFSTTSNFKESLLNLMDFVQNPYFTEENVAKEKGIITQEIQMYEDDPHWQLFFNLLQGLYYQHPVKIDIAGTVESVNKITKDDLYLCYHTFYHPANMVLFLIGDFDQDEIIELIRTKQAQKDFPLLKDIKKIKRVFPNEPLTIFQQEIKKTMNVSRPLFSLGFKEIDLHKSTKNLVKQEIATNMLLDLIVGKGTELYQALYEDGLVDDNFYYSYTRQVNYGYAVIGGETRDPEGLYNRLLKGIKEAKIKIDQENFSRIYKKYIGDYIESFDSFEFIAAEFVNYYFKGVNFLEIIKIMQEIDLNYLFSIYDQLFKKEQAVKSIIMNEP